MSSQAPTVRPRNEGEGEAPQWQPQPISRPGGGSSPVVEKALADVRNKIYPRSVTGYFAKWRVALVYFTQIIFYGLPWLQWNDRQAVLFDLGARKFYIFGMVLWPQDIIYLTVLLVLSAFSLFLFTALAGRLF
ncbi:MAG: cytochrome c oxidase accessory protein CcoG, partial [Alcaligenaceae bacterium]|nr:cytochrome c oxidase accessory protein CcoG [Alcaligenaceae bacterium]